MPGGAWCVQNVWVQRKHACSPPLGCTAASAPAWRSPTWLFSCRFRSATKSPPLLYPRIWITNTLRTYICETQLPQSALGGGFSLSGRLLSAASGNLSDVGRPQRTHVSRRKIFVTMCPTLKKRNTPLRLWNKSNYRKGVGGGINYSQKAKLHFSQADTGCEECIKCISLYSVFQCIHLYSTSQNWAQPSRCCNYLVG